MAAAGSCQTIPAAVDHAFRGRMGYSQTAELCVAARVSSCAWRVGAIEAQPDCLLPETLPGEQL